MSEKYINHITLQSAHSRDSFAREVSRATLEACKKLIEKCLASNEIVEIAEYPGFYLLCNQFGGRVLSGSIWYGTKKPIALANFAIAIKSKNSKKSWAALHKFSTLTPATDSGKPPSVPWIAVSIVPEAAAYPDAMQWFGDFERCLAWAWVTHGQQ